MTVYTIEILGRDYYAEPQLYWAGVDEAEARRLYGLEDPTAELAPDLGGSWEEVILCSWVQGKSKTEGLERRDERRRRLAGEAA